MAGNRGVTVFVLLLSCWHEAKLQPINMTSGPSTEMPPRSKGQEDIPGVFDEILVQEMLDPNKSSKAAKQRTASPLSTKFFKDKNTIMDETFQVGAPQSYHGLSDNSQFSIGNEDKIFNNEHSIDESYQIGSPEGFGKKNSQNDQYKKLSILDKILQNIGKSAAGHSLQ
ncbi:sperm acrosome-associated protein 7-like isoform X1 [Canis lupus familiaris]|uniref:sperm acrosome-associated protein 7 isoform X1 n=1 Tax=Canis lupus dingo TaxID=286419 RepID=UPI0003ADCCC0|nr:sperm acrosome-associated protein 7 isoform X1 [Canis lupus dingo]XP_038287417.1 sperm acrosome-associated protein 7-like isoform X1 [Canis lupus familiaris]XP_038425997.1 sperm acrosome-associated protein 7-like isoform X1 [Canis lupus familiaris]|eukprot:XP_005634165.1 sperm acrosome-associated protein 7 isoform X3 [Canis lupus familiaris]